MSKPSNRIERTDRNLRWVRLGDMRISPVAQREFRPYHADKLSANFDIEEFGNPEVNHRTHDECVKFTDGCPVYVMDGMHRNAALKEFLGEGWQQQKVQAWVTEGKTEEQEAETFLRLNTSLPVAAYDKFQVALTAGRPDECDIDRQVRLEGLAVARKRGEQTVACVGTLRKVYVRSDAATLGRALRIANEAFGESGLDGPIIDGLAHVAQRYNGQVDDAQLTAKLNRVRGGAGGLMSAADVHRKATRKTLAHCVAAAVVDISNRGKGGRKLPSWWQSEVPA